MKTLSDTLADIKKSARESLKYDIKRLRERHKDIAKLVLSGLFTLENVADDTLRYGSAMKIDRNVLPQLRKYFGKPEITGKCVADNGTDITVRVQFAKLKNVSFKYDRAYNPEMGTCRIVEVTQTHTSKQLVCEKQ